MWRAARRGLTTRRTRQRAGGRRLASAATRPADGHSKVTVAVPPGVMVAGWVRCAPSGPIISTT